MADGTLYVSNNDEYRNMTAKDLHTKFQENPGIKKKIMFQASKLRGTKPFWSVRAAELRDMVEQLGLPTIF